MFARTTLSKIADPAVVLVVGWVALGWHSESERYEQIRGETGWTTKLQCLLASVGNS